jgi:hypothetical protein
MGTLARRLRPDIKKPVWHQALRLPKEELISHEQFRKIAHEYMRRMGWDTDRNQYIVIVSDDPKGQHIHIVANRVGVDGSVYLGRNENLISTRVCHELESECRLLPSVAPEYHLDDRGVHRAVYEGPKDRKAKKGERRLAERQAREGIAKPLPRGVIQRILRGALAAGEEGGMAAFLSAAEAGGIRVLANVAASGRVNGLSVEAGGIAIKASGVGDAYAWASLATTVGYDRARDQALLEARSLRHVTRDQLPPLGQPAQSTRLPAVPASADPIVIPCAAKEAAAYVEYEFAYRTRRPTSASPRRLARTPALDRLRSLPRSGLDDLGGRARRLAEAQGLLPRDALVELRGPLESGHRLRHPARGVAGSAAAAGRSMKRDASLLEEVRAAQVVRLAFDQVHNDIGADEASEGVRAFVRVEVNRDTALNDFRAKVGKWGTLYVRHLDDTYAFIDLQTHVKVALLESDSVRAALALAAQKWTKLRVNGDDAFKAAVVREAVALGLVDRLSNLPPKLKALAAAETARLARAASLRASAKLVVSMAQHTSGQPTRTASKSPNSQAKPAP